MALLLVLELVELRVLSNLPVLPQHFFVILVLAILFHYCFVVAVFGLGLFVKLQDMKWFESNCDGSYN